MNPSVPLTRANTATTEGSMAEFGGPSPRASMPNKLRDRSPLLHWHGEYTHETEKQPRILLLDIVRIDEGAAGLRPRVVAEEISTLERLRKLYSRSPETSTGGRPSGCSLRLIHVQNWPEATRYLVHKYKLHEDDALTGQSGFSEFITQKKTRRRAGKPLLLGRTWKVSSDPFRRISKCAVGLDIMKRYRCNDQPQNSDIKLRPSRVTGLMGFDESDAPVLHSNVFAQRTSMYIQYSQTEVQTPIDTQASLHADHVSHLQEIASLYDNGNTIIIFDNSDSGSINDTVIEARGEWEMRWRKMSFYLPVALKSAPDDEIFAGECMRTITADFFKAVGHTWDDLLDASWEHVSILEDKIYEHPADESRAPELWRNQAKWLVYEKLMFGHQDAISELQKYLAELDGDLSDAGQWLFDTPTDFKRLLGQIEEDLVKRTNNLSELVRINPMYKSVAIRDSRESLRLGASMWRLSWVTFIFLPLTFLVSFFGMNVDTFSSNPGLKWYFISAVPFMVAVLVLWYLLKHWFAKSRAMPLQRGAYENMFTDLQSNYPHLWTRQGPRDDIIPADRASRLKWRLVTRWTTGDALPKATGSPGEDDPIGTWNMIKRKLVQRWTAEIKLEPVAKDPETGENGIPAFKNAAGRISEEIDLAPVTEGSSHGRNSQEMVDEKLAGNEEVVTQAGDSERLGFSHVDWARVASMKARKEQARVEELQRKDREGEEKKHG